MNCPNCNSHIDPGTSFCGVCGSKVVLESVQSNLQNENVGLLNPQNNAQIQYNDASQNNYQSQMQHNNGMQNNYQSQMYYQQNVSGGDISDDELIDAYIGKNADKLKNGSFSLNVFFFGNIYVMYRKMWLLGILWFVCSMIVTMFLTSFSSLIILIANIVISVQFKKMYLNHVREQVSKIRAENSGKTSEELRRICIQKGGTTIWPVIIFVVLYVILFALIILVTVFSVMGILDESKENYNNYIGSENNNSLSSMDNRFGELKITIPSQFVASDYNSEYYNSYSLLEDDYCMVSFTTSSTVLYESARAYLEKSVLYSASDEIGSFEEQTINGNVWTSFFVESSYNTTYYYSIVHNDKIYNVEFKIYDDDTGACSSGFSTIVSSLNFD